MNACAPVPDDHPLMIAWKAYQETDDYANSLHWCGEHSRGSMWAAFSEGWLAGRGQTAVDFNEKAA